MTRLKIKSKVPSTIPSTEHLAEISQVVISRMFCFRKGTLAYRDVGIIFPYYEWRVERTVHFGGLFIN